MITLLSKNILGEISNQALVLITRFLCRLFTTVRDSLGLTYDVSFELNLFDRLKLGWYVISVTSTPTKVWAHSYKMYFSFVCCQFPSVQKFQVKLVYRYTKLLMHARMFLEVCIATKLLRGNWTGLVIEFMLELF